MLQTVEPHSDCLETRLSRASEEVECARALWRTVYSEEFGWLPSNADPLADPYHSRSLYAVSRLADGTPIGTMRIVQLAEPGFFISDKLGMNPLVGHVTKGFEVQRLMVLKNFRDRRFPGAPFGVYGAMVKTCLWHAMATASDWVLADCHRNTEIGPLKSMKGMGFRETGQTYVDEKNGEECVVLIIRTKDWIASTMNNRGRFNQYLLAPDVNLTMEV
jgi:hypothetical protein